MWYMLGFVLFPICHHLSILMYESADRQCHLLKSPVILTFASVGHSQLLSYAICCDIWQESLYSIARVDTSFAIVTSDQYEYAVIDVCFSYSSRLGYFGAELSDVVLADGWDGENGYLYTCIVLELLELGFEWCFFCVGDHIRSISHPCIMCRYLDRKKWSQTQSQTHHYHDDATDDVHYVSRAI